MIDSHVHLDHPLFKDDFDEVVARAVEDGVSAIVNIGFDPESTRATAEFVEKYPFFFGVLGTHPHDAVGHTLEYEVELKSLLDRPRMIGVGEIGLDYYYDHSPRDVQRKVFRRMLWMARLKDKPVVIHCRDAERDVLEVLASERMRFGGIFHAFNHDASVARRATELGFHLGIGGVATFKKSKLLDILHAIPLDRIVLETDGPYLAPHPFRGKRNEPALVGFVVEALARIHGEPAEEIARQTTENFLLAMRIEKKSLPPPVYKIGNRVYIHTIPDADPEALADVAAETAGQTPEDPGPVDGTAVKEAVICGFYEPLDFIDQMMAVSGRLRAMGIRVRVVTGRRGHAAVGRGAVNSLVGIADALTVRFYGPTAAQHERTAMTGMGDAAFTSLVEFIKGAVASGIETDCLFVAVPKIKLEPCRELAESLGAGCEVRKFRSLETQSPGKGPPNRIRGSSDENAL
jgi:TatD DNase family protein